MGKSEKFISSKICIVSEATKFLKYVAGRKSKYGSFTPNNFTAKIKKFNSLLQKNIILLVFTKDFWMFHQINQISLWHKLIRVHTGAILLLIYLKILWVNTF